MVLVEEGQWRRIAAGERDEKKESDTMTNRSSGMLVHGYDWVLGASRQPADAIWQKWI